MSSNASATARASRRPCPATYGPKATFSRTVFHGNSEYCWNTMPRSGPGADDLVAVDADPAGGGLHIAGHGVEQGRLAAARRAEQADERARGRPRSRSPRSARLRRAVAAETTPTRPRSRRGRTRVSVRQASLAPRHRGADAAAPEASIMASSRAASAHSGNGRPARPALGRQQLPRQHDRMPSEPAMPSNVSQPPIGCSAQSGGDADAQHGKATTQVGAAQHTTQVMVVQVSAANSRPLPAVAGRGCDRAARLHDAAPPQPQQHEVGREQERRSTGTTRACAGSCRGSTRRCRGHSRSSCSRSRAAIRRE